MLGARRHDSLRDESSRRRCDVELHADLTTSPLAQDALEHINRLQCAAQAQPIVQPSAMPDPRGSVEPQPPRPQPPALTDRAQTATRGWLGSLAAAAGAVLSPQRLLPQLGGALPRTPPAAQGTAPPGQLSRSRALEGDGMLDTAAVGTRCSFCFRVRFDCLLVFSGHADTELHIKLYALLQLLLDLVGCLWHVS